MLTCFDNYGFFLDITGNYNFSLKPPFFEVMTSENNAVGKHHALSKP